MTDEPDSGALSTTIDVQEIMRRIPHRPPFLMIDRAEDFKPNISLIIEAMAQTGGLLMSKSWDVDPTGKIILFMSVDNCRFRSPVVPGDVLRLEVEVARSRADVVKFKGRAMVGSKLAAQAEFAAMLVETKA
jgi:3-hydroxyacyl-[acyl-carrier-protein] dehydratase